MIERISTENQQKDIILTRGLVYGSAQTHKLFGIQYNIAKAWETKHFANFLISPPYFWAKTRQWEKEFCIIAFVQGLYHHGENPKMMTP